MSIYAVIQTGGKQYRVQAGDIVQIEKLEGDVGSSVKFNEILLVGQPSGEQTQIRLGAPTLSGAQVDAEIIGQGRDEKIIIMKFRRRKNYRRTQGHRQFQTQVLITGINSGSGEKVTLSDADKKAKLDRYTTNLAPKGPARTYPNAIAADGTSVAKKTRAKKPAAKKAASAKPAEAKEAATTKKAAPAKKTAKAKK